MKTKIIEIVEAFLRTTKSTPVNLRPLGLQNFPSGACYDSSIVIESLLRENNINDFEAVGGSFFCETSQAIRSHAWLESKDLIIDPTIEQFDCLPHAAKYFPLETSIYLCLKPSKLHERYEGVSTISKLEHDTSTEGPELREFRNRVSASFQAQGIHNRTQVSASVST
ncbi:hypothetical protein [Alcaligenes faecalis]|uniref:Microcin J25-processing protein McjB C-terminal domain-containing protein n=1 Tax=Alcaligenes faecalis TaxID=511 RepID=A0ABY7NBC6_ALCFA|nr:hypothetical protein [Alcaligenes faecalis]WBM39707.1 hypothetical protein M2J83_07815 [Alcaligenes faecalis]